MSTQTDISVSSSTPKSGKVLTKIQMQNAAVRARQGSQVDFARLCTHFRLHMLGLANSYYFPNGDTQDLLQEARFGLHKAVRDYRPGLSSFERFAELCMLRQVISAVKMATTNKQRSLNTAESLEKPIGQQGDEDCTLSEVVPDPTAEVEQLLLDRELLTTILWVALLDLSDLEQRTVWLFADGASYHEMMELLDLPDSKTVDNALQRAKKKLREAIKAYEAGFTSYGSAHDKKLLKQRQLARKH